MSKSNLEELRRQAERLARANVEAEPSIEEVFWFPAEDEIRLVEVDRTTPPSDCISPFYFRADPGGGTGFTSGIAIIRPEEKEKLDPPEGWGKWKDAKKIRIKN